jgi:hypothetical protein
VAVLREEGFVPRDRLAESAGWPDEVVRATRVADALVVDGLACWSCEGSLELPR